MMDLDELQSVQSRERQTDSLQQLRESFYRDAGEYITALREERERAAERADDPWKSPEVSRLSDDIETAEDTVEAIYERRVGKIVKMASLAAAGMPTDDAGLTDEERHLFDSLVAEIETNRDRVEAILDGESPAATDAAGEMSPADPESESGAGGESVTPPDHGPDSQGGVADAPEPDDAAGAPADTADAREPNTRDVDAADLMGSGSADAPAQGQGSDPGPAGSTDDRASNEVQSGERDDGRGREADAPPEAPEQSQDVPGPAGDGSERESEAATEGDESDVDRSTVRITADVGEIFGVDQRSYDLSSADVVTLPEANAEPLVEQGAAERLD